MAEGWGGRRGVGPWERRLTSLTEWAFVVDLLPGGCTTTSDEYRALHREARRLADAGPIQMVTLPRGRKRAAVGPLGEPFNLTLGLGRSAAPDFSLGEDRAASVIPPLVYMRSPSSGSPFRRWASAFSPCRSLRGTPRSVRTRSTGPPRDRVLVHGQLVRRFYRSGAGGRSLTEVVASWI